MRGAASVLERIWTEDETAVEKLKNLLIPQRVGMSVGAHLLVEELSRYTSERIEELRREGALARCLEPVSRQLDADATAALVEPIVSMLHGELARLTGRIRLRGTEWMNASLRLEGELHALEQRILRLDAMRVALATED